MGQYYRALVKKQNGRIDAYNRYVIKNGERGYTFAKLTEHSWWYNDFVNAVCLAVYNRKEKNRIAWIGDYATTFLKCRKLTTFNGLNNKQIKSLTKRCWGCEGLDVPTTDFNLDRLYLINHTKKEYIDCSAYFKTCNMQNGWCLHPLPILTCIGNGLGCGDYNYPTGDSTEEYVGYWAWDEISIEDKPNTKFTQIFPIFKEQGWE